MKALALASLAACSFPTKHLATGDAGNRDTSSIDGRSADGSVLDARAGFECAGKPFPTTAPQTIMFSGSIFASTTSQPVPNFQYSMLDAQGSTVHMGASDNSGNFSFPYPTGGVPVDTHFRTGVIPPYVGSLTYAPHPFSADASSGIDLFTQSDMSQIANACGMNYNGNQPALFVGVADCNGQPLAGVTVSLTDKTIVPCYNGSTGMTSSSGIALFFNLTLAQTTVSAMTMDGVQLYPRDVTLQPLFLTVVGLEPGP